MEVIQLMFAVVLWTVVVADNHSIEKRACTDNLANCEAYGRAACTQYHAWAQHNCNRFCGFCSGGDGSSSGGSSCTDVIDNCAALGPNICTSYVEFVHINCQKTCDVCSAAASSTTQCQDKIDNCAAYTKSACTGQYQQWANDNCPNFCGTCSSTGDGFTGNSNVCYYKGQTYKEGQQWTDGCEKNCTCVDQHTGNYICQALCQTYTNLPADCHMVTPPGECCAKPQCPPKRGCLYKGQEYQEGQEWKDGCDYLCNCKDGTQGYYECRALCIQWNLVSSCHLNNPAPGKCCPTPNCPTNVNVVFPPGYVEY